MKKSIAVIIMICGIFTFSLACIASEKNTYINKLKYAEIKDVNPLSGFVPWGGSKTSFPHTMEYYSISLKDVQKGYNDFDWSILERYLDNAESNGCQAVIRFYIDCPGEESAIPQFLIDDGLKTYNYDLNGSRGICPDYSDANLKKALCSFIQAFGEKYDGDSRIGFIECGLLGFWGEWHTYPYSEWYPSYEVYRLIGQIFDNNFNKTKILVGEVSSSIHDLNIGYHDDMFGRDSDYFYNVMQKNNILNKWMREPVGGEIAPEIQKYCFSEKEEYDNIVKYSNMLHTSWVLNGNIKNYSDNIRKNAENAQKKFGYKFTIESASLKNNELSINIKNVGNAPFYYPWEVVLRITDEDGNEIKRETASWHISDIKELNTTYIMKHTFNNAVYDEGYVISMKVMNPMENGKNVYFANEEQQQDGWIELLKIND